MNSLVNKVIKDQVITIGEEPTYYVNCTITNCKIIYTGGDTPFVGNTKLENCEIVFVGEAQKVINFMHAVGMLTPVPPPRPALQQLPDGGSTH